MKAKRINSTKRLLSNLPTPIFSTGNLALITLLVLAVLGNYWHLPLLFGIDFIFGSIAVFIIIELYGTFWGILAATIASSYTFLLWGHPYAMIIFTSEAVFVGLLRQRKGYSLLLLDGIYWVCLGMPLIFFFYGVGMQVESSKVWPVLFKQPVNGIFNVLVACLLLSYLPILRTLGGSQFAKNFSLKESLIHHLGRILLMGYLAIFSAIFISRKLLEPIENLAIATRQLPEKLLQGIQFKKQKKLALELKKLVDIFQIVAAYIQKSFTELERANQQLNLENTESQKEQNRVEQLNENLEERVKERTAELEISLPQLRGLIQNIKAGILVENEKGYITLVNQEFCNIFALPFPPETLIGTLCADAASAAKELFLNPDEFIARIAETLQPKIPILNEELQLRDGRTLERDYIPVTVSEKFYGNLWLYRDISNRKQVEIEIQTALDKETELNQLKSRLISMTSHEFRTPLTVISSSVGILKTFAKKLSDEQKLEHLNRIETYVGHTTKLLDEILLLNQAEAGKLQFQPALIDLVSFCENLVNEMQFGASDHSLVFTYNCTADNTLATLDEKLLRQVLTNLLSNAIKYSPDGGEVNFTLTLAEDGAIFKVKDSGIGIPPEDQKRLFESFHRAKNVGTIQGTGLGLSIVKKCAQLHGGDVTVESEVGKGTTFTVTISFVNC